MSIDPTIIVTVLGTVFAGGSAWGGAYYALNGTRKRVEKIETTVDDHVDRLARIETKLDVFTKDKH